MHINNLSLAYPFYEKAPVVKAGSPDFLQIDMVVLDLVAQNLVSLDEVSVQPTVINYDEVRKVLTFEDGVYYYPCLGGYETLDIKPPELEPVYPALTESLDELDGYDMDDISLSIDDTNATLVRLRSYLSGDYQMNRTPLLVGTTAVAKSAVIKSLVEELGLRMVDIRCAFLSKLDFEGLTEKITIEGKPYSYNCPADFMVKCTDPYLEYCERMANLLEDRGAPQSLIDKFREESKTPVLFADEITRAPASIRQVLTKVLTDKAFMGLPMKRARVLAATNSAYGTGEEDVYQVSDPEDAAFYDRFESTVVLPDNALPYWKRWAKNNIHPVILSYLEDHPDKYYWHAEVLTQYNTSYDENDLATIPFPNFRTWEMLSKYLYKSNSISSDYIKGLIGPATGEDIIPHLLANGFVESVPKEDVYQDFVDNAIRTSTPTMLIGPSGVAKTARVKQTLKENNAVVIDINLSEMDRSDLMGPPAKVSLGEYLASGVTQYVSEEEVKELTEAVQLPEFMTVKAPRYDMVKKIQKAVSSGRKVALVFDEANRVQNPTVMSAMFEAVSDHRFAGVDFGDADVTVFAMANLGENMGDAKALDPALSARFSMVRQKEYTKYDAQAFLNYARSSKFNPVVLSWLESLKEEELLDTLKSVETRCLEVSAPSTRGLEDLSKLCSSKSSGILDGVMVANIEFKTKALRDPIGCLHEFQNFESNWSGSRLTNEISIGSRKITSSKIVEFVDEFISSGSTDVSKAKKIVELICAVEKNITVTRSDVFGNVLGPVGNAFAKYYNIMSGRIASMLTLADLVDEKNILPFIRQEYAKNSSKWVVKFPDLMGDIWDRYHASKKQPFFKTLIDAIISVCPSTDTALSCMTTIVTGKYSESLIIAEGDDKEWGRQTVKKLGLKEIDSSNNPAVDTSFGIKLN